MKIDQDRDYIKDLIRKSNNVLILSGNKGNDSLGAAITFAIFIDDLYKIPSTVVYPWEFTNINADLLGIYEVKEDLATSTLKIIIDFNGTDIESLNYEIEDENKLILKISPVDLRFNQDRITTKFEGGDFDLIVTVGIEKLEALGEFYNKYKSKLNSTRIINIDNKNENTNYGVVNIVESKADTLSSLVFYKFGQWKYVPSSDASESLLIGMKSIS